jgi:hypothetical protein
VTLPSGTGTAHRHPVELPLQLGNDLADRAGRPVEAGTMFCARCAHAPQVGFALPRQAI